jgi:hypothetical protein
MAHIIERHYYKICRPPQTGIFYIPVREIVQLIRDAADLPASPVPCSLNFQRTMQTTDMIGYDRHGNATSMLSIITNTG